MKLPSGNPDQRLPQPYGLFGWMRVSPLRDEAMMAEPSLYSQMRPTCVDW